MRRRRLHRGPQVLWAALVVSTLLHLAAGIPLRDALARLMSRPAVQTESQGPVRMVRLSPEAYEASLEQARQKLPPRRRAELERAKKRAEKKLEEKKKQEKEETNLKGQVVEVPASEDKRRPENARFLARENSRVERETVARRELRDDRRKRVTNRLQDRESLGGPKDGIPVPGLKAEGDGGKEDKAGEEGEGRGKKRRFELEMPRLARREGVKLDLAEIPELAPSRIWNREESDELPGRSDRMKLELGDREEKAGGRRMGERGGQDGLPSLKDLRPTLGTVARIAGTPSDDYIENVPEGDGTFLNTRSFKYATFFYQVRDSVGSYWKSDVRQEMRRRDPTGDIYGPGDLKTLLFIRLDDTGKLSEVRVEESSGYDFLDAVAVRAFQKAESFPNPPKGIVDANGHIKFHFAFVLYTGRRGPLDLFR